MFKKLFGLGRQEVPPPSVPEATRIYVVGDIHGRVDLLQDLHRQIIEDAATASVGTSNGSGLSWRLC
jgi:serine/threonine protein phosphatase 1